MYKSFLGFLVCLLVSSAAFAGSLPSYHVVDIGVLGADASCAIAVNDNGQVLGKLKENGQWHVFLWDEKNGLEILNLPEGSWVNLNNQGQVAGTYPEDRTSKAISFNGIFAETNSATVFIWDPVTGFYHIGSFDGGALSIVKFNDKGQLLISSLNELTHTDNRIYLWDKDGTVDLVQQFIEQFSKDQCFNGEFYLKASTLNNNSEVVVNAFTQQPGDLLFLVKSFIWSEGVFKELLPEYGSNTSVYVKDLDDHGHMIVEVYPQKIVKEYWYNSTILSTVRTQGYLCNGKTYFMNTSKNIQTEVTYYWTELVIRNEAPQIVFCLPFELKKQFGGMSYYSSGVEITKLLKPHLPYWFDEYFDIKDQNSSGFVVGNAKTIYYNQKQAFLAVPEIGEK